MAYRACFVPKVHVVDVCGWNSRITCQVIFLPIITKVIMMMR